MKKRTITKDDCARFNEYRLKHLNVPYCREQIQTILKDLEFPYNDGYMKYYCQSPSIFRKVRNGINVSYFFTEAPVHIARFQTLIYDATNSRKIKVIEEPSEELCIKTLTKLGYIISKFVLNAEQAMKNPDRPVKDFMELKQISAT